MIIWDCIAHQELFPIGAVVTTDALGGLGGTVVALRVDEAGYEPQRSIFGGRKYFFRRPFPPNPSRPAIHSARRRAIGTIGTGPRISSTVVCDNTSPHHSHSHNAPNPHTTAHHTHAMHQPAHNRR